MHSQISAECSVMPAYPYRTAYAGALDALANYWFKRIELADAGEPETLPEMNLEISADVAFAHCLQPRGVTDERPCIAGKFEDGFSMGIRVAALLARHPFDAETPLRHLVDEIVLTIKEQRQDATMSRIPARSPKITEES
jgi:hypothetical protein